jgi:hypothetical protein
MIRSQAVLIFALALSLFALPVSAQDTSDAEAYRQALQEDITQTREQIRKRGAVFLDDSRTVDERLEAVRDVSALINPDQIERAKRLVASDIAPPIRARALDLMTSALIEDEDFVRTVLDRLADSDEPVEVREAASEAIQSSLMSINFVRAEEDPVRSRIFSTYRSLLDDPEQSLRRDAFEVLVPEGDSEAISRLIEGLQAPEELPMSTAAVLSLVGPRLPQNARELVADIMREPPTLAAQVEAVRLLGGYEPVRETIVGYVQDADAPAQLRLAAAKTLAANAPDRFTELARSIVPNDDFATDLRVFAVEAIRQQRLSRDASTLTRSPDELDRAIMSLAERGEPETLRAVAQRYVNTTYLSPNQ